MTIKELQIIMERAKREVRSDIEVNEFYKKEVDLKNLRKLNKIREEVYQLNKEVGFYGIAGMEYKEFLEAMKGYSYEERMKIAYALLLHIAALDNIVFDEEGEE